MRSLLIRIMKTAAFNRRGFLIALIAFLPLKLAWDVSRIPDYRGGYLEVSYSSDGRYKGLEIIVADNYQFSGWTHFAMTTGGYLPRMFYALADAKTNQILAYIPLDVDWMPTGRGATWHCGKTKKDSCTQVSIGFNAEAVLPPSAWQRLVAKLVVYFKDLENPQFKQVREFENYDMRD